MRDELLGYYERELVWLRQMGADFAERFPKLAARLQLEPTRTDDPHVERLIESFALLAARVHLKLDDEFPRITQELLNIIYPHYVRPVPSFTIVQLGIRPEKSNVTSVQYLPRDSMLLSKPVGGVPCQFQTCYDTPVWPLSITAVQWTTPDRLDPPLRASDAYSALRIELECRPSVDFSQLDLSSLRFYISDTGNVAHGLYELLLNNCTEVVVRHPEPKFRGSTVTLPGSSVAPVGFEPHQALIPYPRRSLQSYRLLQEYFAFPEKFLFFDLNGLGPVRWSGFKDKLHLVFLISRYERADRHELLESGVSARTLRLACTPVINLFPHNAEPIQLNHAKCEYPITVDSRRAEGLEIFSIEEVVRASDATRETERLERLLSFRPGTRTQGQTFWQASRAARHDASGADDLTLTLVDSSGRTLRCDLDTLTIHCLCTNGDLPSKLPFGNESGDFTCQTGGAIDRIWALRNPTPTVRPALGGVTLWKLVSHLSLNYLSLVEDGRQALQEMLRLYQDSSQPSLQQQVDGIVAIQNTRGFARVASDHGITYVRGTKIALTLDEERFVGGGVYLFASILERFFGQYAALNSFTQLAVSTLQRKEVLREWQPRSGERILL